MIAQNTIVIHGPSQPPLPADGPELPALANYIRAGRCALFVGAGFSAPAGLPTWDKLMQGLMAEAMPWAIDAKEIPDDVWVPDDAKLIQTDPAVQKARTALGRERFQELCRSIRRFDPKIKPNTAVAQALETIRRDSLGLRELQRLLEQKRFPELAGHCREQLGREKFQDRIQQALRPAKGLPATHADMVRTPFACVVTTNFDCLIEEAYTRWSGNGIPRAPTGAELSQHGTLLLDGTFFVLKAHGDLRRPDSMIFTADDYRRVIHANPAFQAMISSILLTHAVLFIGYSLSDTNFRLLLDNQLTIFNGNVPPRFALFSGVESAERDILWHTAKLRVLSYPAGQHGEVGRFMNQLAGHFSSAVSRSHRDSTTSETSRASRFPGAPAGVPYHTLHIRRRGPALDLELVQHEVSGKSQQLWVGSGVWPAWKQITTRMAKASRVTGAGLENRKDFQAMARLLTSMLPATLRSKLRSLPPGQTVELACTPESECLPWEWLLIGKKPWCAERPIVRSPIETTNESRGFRFSPRKLRFLIMGDSGFATRDDRMAIPWADWEAKEIVRQIRKSGRGHTVTHLSHQTATRARFLQALTEGYDVIHFAGHAWFDSYESYLYFWDGTILGSEIAPLLSRQPPVLMVLNTHFTAFRPYGVSMVDFTDAFRTQANGSEPEAARGFTPLAMRCGVTSFVGSFGDLRDEPAAKFIAAFYAALLAGETVADSLLVAQQNGIDDIGLTSHFYNVSGYPEFRLVERPPE